MRTNRKNTDAAQRDFEDVPRLTPEQTQLLDLLDELLPDPRFCYSMELERGDFQLLNNYVILHSRTPFEDFEEPDRKRHLYRLWMSIPVVAAAAARVRGILRRRAPGRSALRGVRARQRDHAGFSSTTSGARRLRWACR